MGTSERRERERQEIRELILDAARELFGAEGIEAVTMRKIADKIEYSPTAIYSHFRDKDDLMWQLCDADFRTLALQFVKLAEIADPVERLRQAGFAYVEFGLSHPNHYRLLFMTRLPPRDPVESTNKCGNPDEDAYAFLRASVSAAMAAGAFRPELTDVDLVAQTMWATTHGIAALHIVKKDDKWVQWRPAREIAATGINALMRGLLRDGSSRSPAARQSKAKRVPRKAR